MSHLFKQIPIPNCKISVVCLQMWFSFDVWCCCPSMSGPVFHRDTFFNDNHPAALTAFLYDDMNLWGNWEICACF